MGRRKKPINRTNIPQYQVEAIARCLLPDILAFFESEEGQREFAHWKKEQEEKKKGSIINVGVTQIELKEKIKKKSIFGENPLKWSCQETMNGGQICSFLILHKKC